MAVHSKHARFYERFMGYEQVGTLRDYSPVQDAPAVACGLDFARIDRLRPKCWDNFFALPLPESQLRCQSMSPEDVTFFHPASTETAENFLILR